MSRNDEKFTELVETLALEKNVPQEIIFQALELALAAAMAKEFPIPEESDEESFNRDLIDIYVVIDRKTGKRSAFRRWHVVDDSEYRVIEYELPLSEALSFRDDAKVGEILEEELENLEHCRIGAQTAKQQIYQKIREAERKQLMDEFLLRDQKMIVGAIRRVDKNGNCTVEFGKVDGFLPKEHLLPKDNFKQGDKVKAYLYRVDHTNGTRLVLSRTCNEFLSELFKREVPEIENGQIEIKAIARIPGSRSKVAVVSHDRKINSFGPLIGVKRLRINSIKRELGNEENVDIVEWHEDIKRYVINALSPAEITDSKNILINEQLHLIEVGLKEEQHATAIGKDGQNVKLAGELIGWRVAILGEEDFKAKKQSELSQIGELLAKELGLSSDIVDILLDQDILSVNQLAMSPAEELLKVKGLTPETVHSLRTKAQQKLDQWEQEYQAKLSKLDSMITNLDGMTEAFAIKLYDNEIRTIVDLADLATFELLDIVPELEEIQAKRLIITARKLEKKL